MYASAPHPGSSSTNQDADVQITTFICTPEVDMERVEYTAIMRRTKCHISLHLWINVNYILSTSILAEVHIV